MEPMGIAWQIQNAAPLLATILLAAALGVLSRKLRSRCLLAASICFAIASAGLVASALAPIHMSTSGELSAVKEVANGLSWRILAVSQPAAAYGLLSGAMLLAYFSMRASALRAPV